MVGGYNANRFDLNGRKASSSKRRNRDDKDGSQKNPLGDEERPALIAPESLDRPPHSDNLFVLGRGRGSQGHTV